MYVLCVCWFAGGVLSSVPDTWQVRVSLRLLSCLPSLFFCHLSELLCLSLHGCFLFCSWPSSFVFLPILLSQSDLCLGHCLKPPSIKQTLPFGTCYQAMFLVLGSCPLGAQSLAVLPLSSFIAFPSPRCTSVFCRPGSPTALDVKEPSCFTSTEKGSAPAELVTPDLELPMCLIVSSPLITFYSNTCYLLGTSPCTRHRQC